MRNLEIRQDKVDLEARKYKPTEKESRWYPEMRIEGENCTWRARRRSAALYSANGVLSLVDKYYDDYNGKRRRITV